MKGNVQTIIAIAGTIFVGSALVYLAFSGSQPTGSLDVLNESTRIQLDEGSRIEREIIAELNRIRSIRLEDSIFTSETFRSLVDYSRVIEERPRGRENPFSSI